MRIPIHGDHHSELMSITRPGVLIVADQGSRIRLPMWRLDCFPFCFVSGVFVRRAIMLRVFDNVPMSG